MTDNASGFRKLFEFSVSNFAALSATAFFLMVISAAVLTSGYLSVFDSNLIWLVEYTDLIKFGLVTIVFLAGFLYIGNTILTAVLSFFDDAQTKRFRMTAAALVIASIVIIFSGVIYLDQLDGKDRLAERIATLIVVIGFIFLVSRLHFVNKYGLATVNIHRTLADLTVFVGFLHFVGLMYGNHIRNAPQLSEDIYLDDRILYGARVVLVTGRFAVLLGSDNTVITVPSDRVREILKKWKP